MACPCSFFVEWQIAIVRGRFERYNNKDWKSAVAICTMRITAGPRSSAQARQVGCEVKAVPVEPPRRPERRMTEEEMRMRQELRAKRRQKRRMQQALVVGAFALFLVLVIVCIVMIVRTAFGKKQDAPSSAPPASSASLQQDATSEPDIGMPTPADPTAWNLMLINKNKPMADNYAPPTVVVTNLGHTFHEKAAPDLQAMIDACNAVEGNSLAVTSAYRGATTQNGKHQTLVDVFKSQGKSQEEAEMMANEIEPPYGQSDHQTALAVDFITGTVQEPTQAFAETNEYAWLVEHAAEYGFVLRFPAEKAAITGITYQPYHWRYVGKEDAAVIKDSGICLEEYLRDVPAGTSADSAPESEMQMG